MNKWNRLLEAVGDLNEEEVLKNLNALVSSNPTEKEVEVAIEACQLGMSIVGDKYQEGEYFVGDLIFAGELLTEAINVLKPFIKNESHNKKGKIVLGTVQGDLHDIGKNIFKSLIEADGYEVHDIGIDQPAVAFVDKVKEVQAKIVGMSGVLTLALDSMKDTVSEFERAGLRSDVKIIIGGSPVNEQACKTVGADAYTNNAAEGVKIIQMWES